MTTMCLHRPHRDLLSYVTVLCHSWESVGMTRTNREVQTSLSVDPR